MESSPYSSQNILFLPAHLFRIYVLDVVEEMSREDVISFVALHLEENSPFPLDQLYWGYVYMGDRILAYAAYKNTTYKNGYTDLEQYDYVLPNIIGILGIPIGKSSTLKLQCGKVSANCQFSQSKLPDSITFVAKTNSATEPNIVESASYLLPKEKGTFEASVIQHRGNEETPVSFTSLLTQKSIWDADIRPLGVIRNLQKKQKQEKLINKINKALVLCFSLCLIATVSLFLANQFLHSRTHKIEEQTSAVERIKSDDSLADKLSAFSTNQMRPFSMLHIVNEARPPETLFTKVSCDSWNQILIEGSSPDGTQFNGFIRSLEASRHIEKAKILKQRTTQGKTVFSLEIHVKDTPSYESLDSAVETLVKGGSNG